MPRIIFRDAAGIPAIEELSWYDMHAAMLVVRNQAAKP